MTEKTIDYYMTLPYKLEIVSDPDEGGYVASFPELPGCITSAETMEDLKRNAIDAKRAWLEAALQDGIEIREPQSTTQSRLSEERSLFDDIVTGLKEAIAYENGVGPARVQKRSDNEL